MNWKGEFAGAKVAVAAGVAEIVQGGRKYRRRRNEFAREVEKQQVIGGDWW